MCALAVRPDSANILYSGNGNGHILKSTDSGATWRLVQGLDAGEEIPKIEINPKNPMIAYATDLGVEGDTTLALWKTTDGGEQWFKTRLRRRPIWSLALDYSNPDIVYVGSFSTGKRVVFRSEDGGDTWMMLSHGLPDSSELWNLKIHPANGNVVWLAATAGTYGSLGIFKMIPTPTGIQGVVIDAMSGDTVKNGFFELCQTVDEFTDLALTNGMFRTGFFGDSSTQSPCVHVQAYPYYALDTVVTYFNGSVEHLDLHLKRLRTSSIEGRVEDAVTHTSIQAKVELHYANSLGVGVLYDSTDSTGRFHFNNLYISSPPIVEYDSLFVAPPLPYAAKVITPIVLDTSTLCIQANLDTLGVLLVSSPGSGDFDSYYTRALDSLGVTSASWNSSQMGTASLRFGKLLKKRSIIYYTGVRNTALNQDELDSLVVCLNEGCNLFITGQNFLERNDTSSFVRDYLGLHFGGNSNSIVTTGVTGELFGGLNFLTVGTQSANNQTSRDSIGITMAHAKATLTYGGPGTAAVRLDSTGGVLRLFSWDLDSRPSIRHRPGKS